MIRDMGGLCVCVCVCVFSVCVCVCVCLVCVFSVCLVCVCVFSVCVCIFTRYFNRANASLLFTPHAKKHASQKNLHPTQFPHPTALSRCFALPTRARKK